MNTNSATLPRSVAALADCRGIVTEDARHRLQLIRIKDNAATAASDPQEATLEETLMERALLVAALTTAGASLTGCVVARHQPTVSTPAPTGTTSGKPTRIIYDDATRSISIGYTGADGFRAAEEAAPRYCGERYGQDYAELLTDDRAAGRATFACGVQ